MTSPTKISRHSNIADGSYLHGHVPHPLLDSHISGVRCSCPPQLLRCRCTSSSGCIAHPRFKGQPGDRPGELSRRRRLARRGGRSPGRRVAPSKGGGGAPGRRICLAATGKLLVAGGRGDRRWCRDRRRQRGDRRGLGGRSPRARLLLVLYRSGAPAGFLGRLPVECKT